MRPFCNDFDNFSRAKVKNNKKYQLMTKSFNFMHHKGMSWPAIISATCKRKHYPFLIKCITFLCKKKIVHVQYMGIHLNFENEMLPVTLVNYQFGMTADYIDKKKLF